MKPLKLLTSKTSTEQNSKKHRKSQFHSMEKTFIVLHLSHFYLLLRRKYKKSDYKKNSAFNLCDLSRPKITRVW